MAAAPAARFSWDGRVCRGRQERVQGAEIFRFYSPASGAFAGPGLSGRWGHDAVAYELNGQPRSSLGGAGFQRGEQPGHRNPR